MSAKVLAVPHAFRTHCRAEFDAPGGTPINELFAEALHRTEIDPIHLRNGYVAINGEQVPKTQWPLTCIGDGDQVVIIGGVAGDFGGILLQVAAIGLAAFVPAFGPTLFAGVSLGQLAVRAGITIISSLAAQALAPSPRRSNLAENDPIESRFSISGTRNQAQPYGIVPRIFGKVKNYRPPLAAQPYTAIHGADNQSIFMLFCIGEGYLRVTDLMIGDQQITQLPDLSYQIKTNVTTSTMPSLYPSRVTQETLSIQLKNGTWHQRTSPVDTNEIFIEVTFPSGLGRLTDRNVKFGITVEFWVQYRSLPSGGWTNAPITNAGGATINGGGRFSVAGYYKSAVRRAVKFNVPNGQYEVRVIRVTVDDQSITGGENQSNTFENSYWSNVRFHDNSAPIAREGVTLLAVRAKATDSLNGVIDQLTCTAEAYIPYYTGSSWGTKYTRNPAWAFAEMLRGTGNSTPIPDSRIDADKLKTWADQCDAWEINFDGVFNYDISVWDALNEAAAVGRASPLITDSVYGVFVDTPQTTPVQLITPRNSTNAAGSRIFADAPHALKVRFPNELTSGQIDEINVYADGYNASNATKIEAIELPWTTSATAAWREARVMMAKAELRNEILSRTLDIEHLKFSRGDYVQIQDDVMLTGLHSARVASIALPDITLDAPLTFTMEADTNYSIRVRHNDGFYESELVTDITATDTVETVTLTAPDVSVGDLIVIGESTSVVFDALVRSIQPKSDGSADCTFLPAATNLYDAISGPIPNYDPGITLPPPLVKNRPPQPQITSVTADESVIIGVGYSSQATIALGLQVDTSAELNAPEFMQVRYRVYDYATEWSYRTLPWFSTEVILSPIEDGANYEIEARTVNQFGLSSDWARTTILATGRTNPPPDVERFYRQGNSLTWPYPDPPLDFVGFRLRANFGQSDSIDTAYNVTDGLISAPPFDISDINGTQTFILTAVDSLGIESETPAVLTINIGDAVTDNLLLTQDEDGDGYLGTKTNCTVNGTDLEADDSGSAIYWRALDAAAWLAATDPAWPTTSYLAMSYSTLYEPVTDHIGATVKVNLATVGDITLQYRIYVSPAYWGASGSAHWGAAGDPAWPASTVGELATFPGVLGPIVSIAESYEFLVSIGETDSDSGRGEITNFDILVDVPDITEYFEDFAVAATGTVRLPIAETYRAIKVVNLTVQDTGSGGGAAAIIDKDETLGPNIETYNFSGTRAARTVDAVIIGY